MAIGSDVNHIMVLLAGSAGMRRGEIMALKWSDLDLKRRLIQVQRSILEAHETVPKGGKGRVVDMTSSLANALAKHRHLRGDRVLYARNVANRRESEGSLATVGDDSLRAIAKPPTPRAVLIADLAEHVKELVVGGDIEAARVAADAIGRLLGSSATAAPVIDLARARTRRGD